MDSLSDDQLNYNIGLLKPSLFPNYSVLYGAVTFLLYSPPPRKKKQTKKQNISSIQNLEYG